MREEQTGINVLHVDDEPNFLALTKAFLERENREFSIDTATPAEEGFELLKSGKYGVVVSDYKMPVMDGLEFLKTLRVSGNTIPFIMFTGKGREEVAIEALNRGADTDITERKRAEEELRQSEEKYHSLVEFSER